MEDPGAQASSFNAYRYNSKRWQAGSNTYDMGFRDYSPGLSRFTTRDTYNGALADMGLGTDSYTGNRYAFTGGNPISRVELDGHEPRPWHETGKGFSDFEYAEEREADGAPKVIGPAVTGDESGGGSTPRSDISVYDASVESGGIHPAIPWWITKEGWTDVLFTSSVNFGIDTVHAFQDPALFFEYWGGPQQWSKIAALEILGLVGVGKLAVGGLRAVVRVLATSVRRTPSLVASGGAANTASGAGKIPWTSYSQYPKVTQGGREYAQVGNRLYTQHAVDRMQPSGLGAPAGAGGVNGAGRSISPNFIEDVLTTAKPKPATGPKGQPRLSYESGSVQIVTENDIVVTVITR